MMPRFSIVIPPRSEHVGLTGESIIIGNTVRWVDEVKGVVIVALEHRPKAITRDGEGDLLVLQRAPTLKDGQVLWP